MALIAYQKRASLSSVQTSDQGFSRVARKSGAPSGRLRFTKTKSYTRSPRYNVSQKCGHKLEQIQIRSLYEQLQGVPDYRGKRGRGYEAATAQAYIAQQRSHGWQLYVTNSPADKLSLAEAILAYRQTPTFERGFSRLKNRPLGLRPLYLV